MKILKDNRATFVSAIWNNMIDQKIILAGNPMFTFVLKI